MTQFGTTHWSTVLCARGQSADARAAIEALCRIGRRCFLQTALKRFLIDQ